MKGNNIILIGMMGAGKTTIGKKLNSYLEHYNLVDIDSLIEDREKMTVSEIFEKYGEKTFRNIESEIIIETCKNSNLIISTGGGVFENGNNRKVLLKSGKVFYLYALSQVLYDRIKTQGNRPLLQCENPQEVFTDLLDKRDTNYKKADYIIDTSSSTIDLVAKEILRRVNETVNIS